MASGIVISGRHEATNERYAGIVESLKSQGLKDSSLHVPDWTIKTVEQQVSLLVTRIAASSKPITLVGFSMGAMLALIASARCEVENLVLCSPSGYFKEYIRYLSADDLAWAREDIRDFENFSSVECISKTTAKNVHIVAGENELKLWPDFKIWINELRENNTWHYHEVPLTGHDIEAPAYQNIISDIIDGLFQ